MSIYDGGDPGIEWAEANAANDDGQAVTDAGRAAEEARQGEADKAVRQLDGHVGAALESAYAARSTLSDLCGRLYDIELADSARGGEIMRSLVDALAALGKARQGTAGRLKEITDAERDAELAALRAENTRLREALATRPGTEPGTEPGPAAAADDDEDLDVTLADGVYLDAMYLLACGDQFSNGRFHVIGDAVRCPGHGPTHVTMTIPLGAPAAGPDSEPQPGAPAKARGVSKLTITDTEMISDTTRHQAGLVKLPSPLTGYSWQVTWLPGRHLSRDQAITAMTIAEFAVTHRGALGDVLSPAWSHLAAWADEIGITPERALAMVSVPPQDRTDGRPAS